MERRQDSLVPSVLSAGTDPAHVPGLDDPAADQPGTAPGEAAGSEVTKDGTSDETAQDEAVEDSGPQTDETDDADEDEAGPEAGEKPEGPAFEASDRRGAIVADGSGILFRLDDTEARLTWGEIGAVEVGTQRFGRRFSVTVYTTDRRCFDGDVEATARRDLRTWTEQFDAVLDAWFDDGGDKEDHESPTAEEPAEEATAEEAETEKAAK